MNKSLKLILLVLAANSLTNIYGSAPSGASPIATTNNPNINTLYGQFINQYNGIYEYSMSSGSTYKKNMYKCFFINNNDYSMSSYITDENGNNWIYNSGFIAAINTLMSSPSANSTTLINNFEQIQNVAECLFNASSYANFKEYSKSGNSYAQPSVAQLQTTLNNLINAIKSTPQSTPVVTPPVVTPVNNVTAYLIATISAIQSNYPVLSQISNLDHYTDFSSTINSGLIPSPFFQSLLTASNQPTSSQANSITTQATATISSNHYSCNNIDNVIWNLQQLASDIQTNQNNSYYASTSAQSTSMQNILTAANNMISALKNYKISAGINTTVPN